LSQHAPGYFFQNDTTRRHWSIKVLRDRALAWEKPTDPSLLRMWEKLFKNEPEPFTPARYIPPRPILGDEERLMFPGLG
jgi:hypothetical protein